MRILLAAVLLALLPLPIHAADPIDPAVLAVREAAWRAWFAGDEAALRTILPDDFLAIGASGTAIATRHEILANSRAFKESGRRLVSLSFPETRAQRYGDTVILYGSYEAVLVTASKEETTMRGRLTEVFIRRDGRWVHPGWHLDMR